MNNWTIQDDWNNTLLEKYTKPEPREYIRASEIGGSFQDRYYKMTGEDFTNPFDTRVLRIFEAGNIFEMMVALVLIRAGYFKHRQEEVTVHTPGNLDVIGHYDFVGGGKRDMSMAKDIDALFNTLGFNFRLFDLGELIAKKMESLHPEGVPEVIYEIKSINSMVFWKHKRNAKEGWLGYPHHRLQLYSYLKGKNLPEGRILYISKDDLELHEVSVTPDERLEAEWMKDVSAMSKYFLDKTCPPAETAIAWNEDSSKYEMNWKLARSNYFTKITGVSDQDSWEEKYKNLISRANYRVKKLKEARPDVTDDQIQMVVDQYIEAELSGTQKGGITIS